jgi:peptide-methionine (S)-S-oxide reductase
MNDNQMLLFASGCFWCTEAVFTSLKGVVGVRSGYAGGFVKNPCYREVCNGTTGHAECVRVEYNPTEISLDVLLTAFFSTHDPTTLNRQGYDVGTQYRSALFYTSEDQKNTILDFITELIEKEVFTSPIVTEVLPYNSFYEAEQEHHRYYERNPEMRYCEVVIAPKLAHFKAALKSYLKN